MSAVAYRAQVYTTLANLLAGWTPFSGQCASFFRFDQPMAATSPTANLSDVMFPRWVLWPGTNPVLRMWDVAPSFADNVIPYNAATAGSLQQFTDRYMLSIVSRSPYSGDADQLAEDAAAAIRQGGPRLNLPFVRNIDRIDGRRSFGVSDGTAGKPRWEYTMIVPVRFEFQGSTLLT